MINGIPLDDKIVLYGMSCSGKTTFATNVKGHRYICFDEFFPWHDIETLGISAKQYLIKIRDMLSDKCILDGWHLSDKNFNLLSKEIKVYAVYSEYDFIVNNYRGKINGPLAYENMYDLWYTRDLKVDKYIRNKGNCFIETSFDEYLEIINMTKHKKQWNKDTWSWI